MKGISNNVWFCITLLLVSSFTLADGSLEDRQPTVEIVAQQTGYAGQVRSVAFSPDGKVIAAGSLEDVIKLWDTTTGEQLRSPEGHNNGVYRIAFSPDGNLLASGGADRRIKLWNAATGKLQQTLEGQSFTVHAIAFSPDARVIATTEIDDGIALWDIATGKRNRILKGHSDGVYSLAFSPDGNVIASGSRDETIRLWNVATGEQLRSLGRQNSWVTSLAFSPNGKMLASLDQGYTIKLWDVATGNEQRSLKAETGINSIAFSPDGNLIASGCDDGTIKLWDAAAGEQRRSLAGHTAMVNSVAFSPDGKMIGSGSDDHTIRLWDAVTGTQLRSLGGPAVSPTPQAQGAAGITEKSWRQHPKIKAIQKIVSSVNAGLKKRNFKTAQRKLQCDEVPYFTLKRIARDSKGTVAWYEDYSESEDSSWDYHQYYDSARRLRFALIIVYAANGSREQHRVYFDETGKLIWQSRKTLKGPGYFAPHNVEELPKEDPSKEFETAPNERCKEIKPKARRTAK